VANGRRSRAKAIDPPRAIAAIELWMTPAAIAEWVASDTERMNVKFR